MIRVCSYCKKDLGEKEPLSDKRVTHGICEDCVKGLMAEIPDLADEISLGKGGNGALRIDHGVSAK